MASYQDLIAQAKAGNATAITELLDRYRPYLTLLARLNIDPTLTPKVDGSDVVQETAILVSRDFHQFRGSTEKELLAWLRQVLAHVVANIRRHYRTQRRDVLREQRLLDQFEQSSQILSRAVVSAGASPSELASYREQGVILAEALSKLPEHYREVLILRELKELSMSQVAERMGRSVGSVEKLWARALVRIRKILKEEP